MSLRPAREIARTVAMLVPILLALIPATAASAASTGPPVNTKAPAISGSNKEGQTLKASKGAWTGQSKIAYTYQWKRCNSSGSSCVSVTSATKSSYKLSAEDVGHAMIVVVTATNGLGSTSASAAPTSAVTGIPPTVKAAPKISGTAKGGQTLTSTTGTWIGTTPISYAYQWQACNSSGASCTNIANATSSTFALTNTQAGGTVRVIVTASNAAGEASSTSKVSKVVAAGAGTVPRIDLCGTISKSQTLSPEAASVYALTCNVTVAKGATLTVAAGTVVKAEDDDALEIEGTLDAPGTAANPITFTSINDNTIGGNTGSGSPASGDWAGIAARGAEATLDLQHVNDRYAALAVRAGEGPTTLSSVAIAGAETGVYGYGSSQLSVTESTISSQWESIVAGEGPATITGDTLTELSSNTNGPALQIATRYFSGLQPATVAHNTVSVATASVPAIEVQSSDLNFGELATDTISGPVSARRTSVGGRVAASQTWSPASFGWSIDQKPVLVQTGVTLTVAAGTVVKSSATGCVEIWGCGEYAVNEAAAIAVEGTLDAPGTAANPITFTSINDNTIGGNTGSGSPASGDWAGIAARGAEATLDLQHVNLSYARTGIAFAAQTGLLEELTVSNSETVLAVSSGNVAVRATLQNDAAGIEACTWRSGVCSVDAGYTYWGSSAGPFPGGEPPVACGAVTVSPYLTSPKGTSTATAASAFSSIDCGGINTLEQEFNEAAQSGAESVAAGEAGCAQLQEPGNPGVCEVAAIYERCLNAAVKLASESSGYGFPDGAQSVAGVGATAIESSENRTVSDVGRVASKGLQILNVVGTIKSVADAYKSCERGV